MPYGSLASEPGFKRVKPISDSLNRFHLLLGRVVRRVIWAYLIDTAGTQGLDREVIGY